MSVVNNSGDMSSSASPDEGTIPSKEFRKRQVRELQKLDEISISKDVHCESNKESNAFIYVVTRSNFPTGSISYLLRTV